jgi:uncharacterized protein (DUF362 family)
MKLSKLKKFIIITLILISLSTYSAIQSGVLNNTIYGEEQTKVDTETTATEAPDESNSQVENSSVEQTQKMNITSEKNFPSMSLVSAVQSQKKYAKDITSSEIDSMVKEAVWKAGGLRGIVKDGQVVVIKPNLVQMRQYTNGQLLPKEMNAVTTDWRITKAVVDMVRDLNPKGKIYVMEGSASAKTLDVMNHLNYTKKYMPKVDGFIGIETESGKWMDYKSPLLSKVYLKNALYKKTIYMNKIYKNADVLISIPCLKNTTGVTTTGSVKNVSIGAAPANIYGNGPNNYVRTERISHQISDGILDMWIADFYTARPVNFTITDGLEGLQNGPFPYKVGSEIKDKMNMRMILAGKDAIAVDTVQTLLMNWDPSYVKYLVYLNKSKIGISDTSKIIVKGIQVDKSRKNFSSKSSTSEYKRIKDHTPPTLTIKKQSYAANYLSMTTQTGNEAIKLEVYLDGELYSIYQKGSFSQIKLDFSKANAGIHKVKLCLYDRFLNHSEKLINFEKIK